MTTDRDALHQNADLLAAVRAAARQEQFLEVILPEEARRRFEGAIDRSPLTAKTVRITQALGIGQDGGPHFPIVLPREPQTSKGRPEWKVVR